MYRARGAPDCARGERDPREDAAKVAFLKSISLETLVLAERVARNATAVVFGSIFFNVNLGIIFLR